MSRIELTLALTELIQSLPRRTRRVREERWRNLVTSNPLLAEAAADFFFSLYYRNVLATLSAGPETERQRRTRAAVLVQIEADWAAEVAATQAEIVNNLLEFLTPLGKPLGDCTGAECLHMEGFFGRVGRSIPANGRVREYLNNNELRDMIRQQMPSNQNEQRTNV
jgi:hypothetical protein